jgi:hypothetical protein
MEINLEAFIGQELSDTEIAKMVARQEYALGWMQVQVEQAALKVVDKEGSVLHGCLQFERRVTPLAIEGDPTSGRKPLLFDSFTIPLPNLEIPGHKPPSWTIGFAVSAMHAMFPEECPLFPRRVDGVLAYDGEEISAEQEAACRVKAGKAVMRKIKELMAEPDAMIGQVYYAELAESVSKKDGKTYRNLSNHSPELPEGETLLQGKALYEETEVVVEEPKKAAKGAKAPAGKVKGKR